MAAWKTCNCQQVDDGNATVVCKHHEHYKTAANVLRHLRGVHFVL